MADCFVLISTHRRRVADLLDGFGDDDWATPSLCDGWTVQEVVAHLLMPFRLSLPRMVVRMIRFRGDFDRLSDTFAHETAAGESRASLVATLRANAEHRFTPPGFGPEAPLADIVLHGMDIAVPTGRTVETDPEALVTVLGLLATPKASKSFVGKDGLVDLRFEATDLDWSHGNGRAVRGPAASLALAMAGRRVGLESLTGDGVDPFAARLAAAAGG